MWWYYAGIVTAIMMTTYMAATRSRKRQEKDVLPLFNDVVKTGNMGFHEGANIQVRVKYFNSSHIIGQIVGVDREHVHPVWRVNDTVVFPIVDVPFPSRSVMYLDTNDVLLRVDGGSVSDDDLVQFLGTMSGGRWLEALNHHCKPGQFVLFPLLNNEEDLVAVRIASLCGARAVAMTNDFSGLGPLFLRLGGEKLFSQGDDEGVLQWTQGGVHVVLQDISLVPHVSLKWLRKLGKLVLSFSDPGKVRRDGVQPVSDVFQQVTDSISIIGAHDASRKSYRQLLRFCQTGQLQFPIDRIPLRQFLQGSRTLRPSQVVAV